MGEISSWTNVVCAVVGDNDPLMKAQELEMYGKEHDFPVLIEKGTGHGLKSKSREYTMKITASVVDFVMSNLIG